MTNTCVRKNDANKQTVIKKKILEIFKLSCTCLISCSLGALCVCVSSVSANAKQSQAYKETHFLRNTTHNPKDAQLAKPSVHSLITNEAYLLMQANYGLLRLSYGGGHYQGKSMSNQVLNGDSGSDKKGHFVTNIYYICYERF